MNAGGRTGLTAMTVAVLFLLTLFIAPLRPENELPSTFNCFASALLPVALIALSLLD